MKKIKFICRNYQTKDGRTFTKLSVKGKFLNDILADDEANYRVRFTKNSQCQEPKDDGIYEIAFNDGELWIDTRPEYADKFIVHVVAQKVKFSKPLPKLDKDVRL
ncbi:MAG: hypothetical protein J6S67_05435 [Methanobrevibacter sp.]|nr:hypothetical protein [Methanobrevibacter sp.]